MALPQRFAERHVSRCPRIKLAVLRFLVQPVWVQSWTTAAGGGIP
jgi:hypothetical protein